MYFFILFALYYLSVGICNNNHKRQFKFVNSNKAQRYKYNWTYTALHNTLWSESCKKRDVVLNDCNWCWCDDKQRYHCEARVCEEIDMFGHFKGKFRNVILFKSASSLEKIVQSVTNMSYLWCMWGIQRPPYGTYCVHFFQKVFEREALGAKTSTRLLYYYHWFNRCHPRDKCWHGRSRSMEIFTHLLFSWCPLPTRSIVVRL